MNFIQPTASGPQRPDSGERRTTLRTRLTVAATLALGVLVMLPGAALALERKLVASDGAANDQLGRSVAVDGDTAVVGSAKDDGDRGAVYVFTRTGDSWTQTAKLTATDGAAGDFLGFSVAIDGDTIVAGANFDDVASNTDQGSVYTFARTGEQARTETAKLTASDGPAMAQLGRSVAIDGDTIVAGAASFFGPGSVGSAYTFASTGLPARMQTARLTASDGATFNALGTSVAIDGDTIVAGAPGTNLSQGSAYTFARTGAARTETAKLTASDGAASDFLGFSVGIAGGTIVAGAYGDDVGANASQGSAYTFARTGAPRTESAKLTASDGSANDELARSVAIDRETIVAGSAFDDSGANANQGSAYTFSAMGDPGRRETARLVASDGGGSDQLGTSAGIDGDTIIAGAPFDDIGDNADQGSASIFFPPAPNGTRLVSRASGASGAKGNGFSSSTPSVSADGRFIAFRSSSSNLDPADTDTTDDVFVRDLQQNTTTLVSRASGADGAKGNGFSSVPTVSADGRFIAFRSAASNLDPADTDTSSDVFVRDLQQNTTTLVSRASGADGAKGNGFGSGEPTVSADGRFIAFRSSSSNLDPADTDPIDDVFVRDLQQNTTTLVSRANGADGAKANDLSFPPAISADGRFVAFTSSATNLDPADTDFTADLYLRDLQQNTTTLVSRASGADGAKANRFSSTPAVSADGRSITFRSAASNLDPADTDTSSDVFVRDLQQNTTTLVSRASGADGAKGNGGATGSLEPTISADGRFVAFRSSASNLDPADTDTSSDAFVRDLALSTTRLASRASGVDGAKGNGFAPGTTPALSGDGRFVAFSSASTNLDPADTDTRTDVFVRDLGPPSDVTPPETTIDSGPSGPTNDPTPTFGFSSDEAGSSFECRVDTAVFASCSSPLTTDTLPDGAHTFEVRATDQAGNTDPTPATRSFTVDTSPPPDPDPDPDPSPNPSPNPNPNPNPSPNPNPPPGDGDGSGRLQPNVSLRIASARQVGRRVRVRATGVLSNVRGRPCAGRIAVGVKSGGRRRARRVGKVRSSCRYTVRLSYRVSKLPRRLRPRSRRLLVRVTASYKGTTRLKPARPPSQLRRVTR